MEKTASIEIAAEAYYEGFASGGEILERQQIEAEAWQLINNRESRPAAEVPVQEYRDNARTALMEALTASGHLSRVEISGTLQEINDQILTRLLNGWDTNKPLHEKQRRFAELCNELVIQKLHKKIEAGEVDGSYAVAEISDYPISLSDSQATKLGYRASNRKGMVRSTHLRQNEDGSYTRIIEQVSRANGTAGSSFRFFKAASLDISKSKPADLAVLEAPFVYSSNEYEDAVVDIMRRLDQQAVGPALYGESADSANRHVPYTELRLESARRESEIEHYIEDLANLEEQLASKNEYQRADKKQIYNQEVARILTVICTMDPAYAEDTFGKKAAPHFYEAARLEASGNSGLAQQLLQDTSYLKEVVTFCGESISVEEAQQKHGLKVNGYTELMEKARKNWKWKDGKCVVKECPTRPAKTKVGPCSVCFECQKIYDKGDDPKRVYKTIGFLDWLFRPSDRKT